MIVSHQHSECLVPRLAHVVSAVVVGQRLLMYIPQWRWEQWLCTSHSEPKVVVVGTLNCTNGTDYVTSGQSSRRVLRALTSRCSLVHCFKGTAYPAQPQQLEGTPRHPACHKSGAHPRRGTSPSCCMRARSLGWGDRSTLECECGFMDSRYYSLFEVDDGSFGIDTDAVGRTDASYSPYPFISVESTRSTGMFSLWLCTNSSPCAPRV